MAPTVSPELPQEVTTCLRNARYLHLATSDGLWPHVSLMNYTYLPTPPRALPNTPSTSPIILLTTQSSTKKTSNLLSNPRVSLLVHDWVSHRSSGSSQQSSLAELLTNINTAAMSSISATLFGYATVLEEGSEEERFYREVHEKEQSGGGESSVYVSGEGRMVVVRVTWARVADHTGAVRDWVLEGEEERWREEFEAEGKGLPNGA